MIYEAVSTDVPIQQGDIFRNIPRVEFSMSQLIVDEGDEEKELTTWDEVVSTGSDPVTALLPVEPVIGIVITQNCDASRGRDICLCQVSPFLPSVGQESEPKNANKWNSLILKHMRSSPRIFYLPMGDGIFDQRMAVDFRSVLRVPLKELYDMRQHRIARLNEVANEHFRESLGQFFRRYAFNEWYPLTKEEAEAYAEKSPEEIHLYPWQK